MNVRKNWLAVVGAAALAAVCGANPAFAGEAEMQSQMAEMMKLAQPGEHHEFLKKMVGTWKATAKMWMQPGAPPIETVGTSTNELILGGRFLRSQYEGTFMNAPFHGVAVDGFDNNQQKYVGTWMDSMGTMMMTFEGTADPAGKVRTMVSEFLDPMSGTQAKMKGITRIVDRDTHTYEGWQTGPDGKFVKMMEITYRRQ